VMPCGFYLDDARAQAEAHREQIATLGATRVFAVDAASTYSRPGPRLVDGTEMLAHLFHPDRVAPPEGIGFVDLSAEISQSARAPR
jgi:iron complex transport system substrate-binding protein